MTPDKLGFLHPQVDTDKCVDCGLCVKVCNFKSDYSRGDGIGYFDVPKILGGRLKDTEQLARSQSGGAAFALPIILLEIMASFMELSLPKIFW